MSQTVVGELRKYAVIIFEDKKELDESCEVIPSSWLLKDRKSAWWPVTGSDALRAKAVRKCVEVGADWNSYPCRVIGSDGKLQLNNNIFTVFVYYSQAFANYS